MSKVRAASTYKVEYGKTAGLSCQDFQLHCLFRFYCSDSEYWSNADGDRMDIDRCAMQRVIDELRKMDEENFRAHKFAICYTKYEIADLLQSLLEEADPDDSVVHLFWF